MGSRAELHTVHVTFTPMLVRHCALQLIIPRGTAHSLRNVGTETSINFSAFNSENPGTGVRSSRRRR